MVIDVRPQSYNDPELMAMLRRISGLMAETLSRNGIDLVDGSMKIWVKRHERTGNLYPKIEIDAHGQELQYGLDRTGAIKEVHFKSFDRNSGRISRADLDPADACELLQRIHRTLLPQGITEN